MTTSSYGIEDFRCIAAGAAILASGGGGSYEDAVSILDEIAASGWTGAVSVKPYDGATDCCVLALMGSPDAAEALTLADIENAIINTVALYQDSTGSTLGCVIPVEVGPINALIPLIAAALSGNAIDWVVDGDGAGRAVPELPQTTYSGAMASSPCALANDASESADVQSAVLSATTAAQTETLAGGIVSAFGSFSGIALWPSNAGNNYALAGNYIKNTLSQAWALGKYLIQSPTPPSTADVVTEICSLTGRTASAVATNFFITDVTQSTTSASMDTGVIRLDNAQNQADSTETHYIYNLNENLIMYSSMSNEPDIIAPDSICYYSESTGCGFSNAESDLAVYFDTTTGSSTGKMVSVIKVEAAEAFYSAQGVVSSFAALLRNIGYAGKLPNPS
ncbi:DUF917 family protein [Halothiobacillus sp.]|uniref:S-methyl thiohydantoin desulfurase domain-containing protein n=1 Tax=Halothiobacillus sp. TaxID=1891311 RepID=UPI002622D233|nr:DUF917 family protein [Halothiobacillus sp.]MDD4965359.1 DUF917 family protein [Halothiobacillus sp.]